MKFLNFKISVKSEFLIDRGKIFSIILILSLVGFQFSTYLHDFGFRGMLYIYRALSLFITLMLIFSIVSDRNYNLRNTNLTIVLFLLFWLGYSFRLVHDMAITREIIRDPLEYLLFAYGITLIPCLAIILYRPFSGDFQSIHKFILLLLPSLHL